MPPYIGIEDVKNIKDLMMIHCYLTDKDRHMLRFGELDFETENLEYSVEKVYFNNPATVVIWKDHTKTIVKCQPGDEYDKEKGLAMCFMKKVMGNNGNFNEQVKLLIDPDYKEKKKAEKKAHRKAKKMTDDECPFN